MTTEEKQQLEYLRSNGIGYKKIAQTLGLAESTVKSYAVGVFRIILACFIYFYQGLFSVLVFHRRKCYNYPDIFKQA